MRDTLSPMASPADVQVTVVVLTYDRPRALRRCLRSLCAQNTALSVEIVVADDGSGPATAEVVRAVTRDDPRVRHVRGPHRGIAAARNLGVGAARGRYVAIVADDYVLAPHFVSTAIEYLEAHPEADVVRFDILPLEHTWGARVSHTYYAASIARRLESEGITDAAARRGVATRTLEASGAAVFRRATLDAVGPWNETLQRGEDTEQTARLRAAGMEVHLLAAGTVRTSYRRVPFDTLRKSFLFGLWRTPVAAWSQPVTLRGKAHTLRRAIARARSDGESTFAALSFVPWMVAFEAAALSGVVWGRRRRRSVPAAPAPLVDGVAARR